VNATTASLTPARKPRVFDVAKAFAGKDFRIARSYRTPFFLAILSTFMSLVTFRFISELIKGSNASAVAGDYFAFVVVGMAVAQVLEGSLSGPTGAARGEQVQGTLEILATQPISPAALGAGWAAYPVLQALVTGGVMIGIAALMGVHFNHPDWLAATLAMVASALVFAALGILGAAFVLIFQQGGSITSWITGGLSLVSGVFFPLKLLPGWVQTLAQLSPLTHSLRALRGSLLGGLGLGDVAVDLAVLAAFAVVLLPLAFWSLSLALKRARLRGTLSGY
jgi:ABC-2 type transport system permease protein